MGSRGGCERCVGAFTPIGCMRAACVGYNLRSRAGILMRPRLGGDHDEGTSIRQEDVREV
jgi:hypothetical protein